MPATSLILQRLSHIQNLRLLEGAGNLPHSCGSSRLSACRVGEWTRARTRCSLCYCYSLQIIFAVLGACMLPGTRAGILLPQVATLVVCSSACKAQNTGSNGLVSVLTPQARVQIAYTNEFDDWRNPAKCVGDLIVMVRPRILDAAQTALMMHYP